ncbi:unnamed protein product [Adineta steineri]|uniref:Uncharacterized protein n=1 Tax=Adineta steineri TaxID=433720 RepID=A0A815ITA3_9BILA|nr:unnamed protein product [Adineta steineri]CAF1461688.1 unnamed protein product [Adineta steineri]CAF4103082.1 unnamed protein product [Adineta steineri]CAF4137077.1 unnamed protein product [Adineta steineri]
MEATVVESEEEQTSCQVVVYNSIKRKVPIRVKSSLEHSREYVLLQDVQDHFSGVTSFTLEGEPLPFLLNNSGHRMEPWQINAHRYHEIEAQLPEQSSAEASNTSIDNSSLVILWKNIEKRLDTIEARLDTIEIRIEDVRITVIERTNNIMNLNTELVENSMPRFFFVVKEPGKIGITRRHFRLHFLCECKEQDGMHEIAHEGYEIKKPREFFIKYGSYLRKLIKIVRGTVLIGGIIIPTLAQVASNISIPDVLCEGNLWDAMNTVTDVMDANLLPSDTTTMEYGKTSLGAGIAGAQLRDLAFLLYDTDPRQSLGNLNRITDADGHVRWVCMQHLNTSYGNEQQSAFIRRIETMRGKFDSTNGRVVFNNNQDSIVISEFCTIIQNGMRIKELHFYNFAFKSDDFVKLVETLKDSLIHNLTLYNVTVFGWKPLKVAKSLQSLSEKQQFWILYVVKKDNSDELINYIIRNKTNMFFISQTDRNSYLQIIPASNYEWKPILNLETNNIVSNRELRVYDMFIEPATLKIISNALNSSDHITRISFKKIDFTVNYEQNSIGNFAKALWTNTSVSWLLFEECDIKMDGILAFVTMLKHNKNLRDFTICKQKLPLPVVEELCSSLEVNTKLTMLNLAHDQLTPNLARLIGNACISHPIFTNLDISYNNIGNEGIICICKSLENSTTLETLSLSNEKFNEQAIQSVADLIMKNRTLRTLVLLGESIEDAGLKFLLDALKQNEKIDNITLSANGWSGAANTQFKTYKKIIFR